MGFSGTPAGLEATSTDHRVTLPPGRVVDRFVVGVVIFLVLGITAAKKLS